MASGNSSRTKLAAASLAAVRSWAKSKPERGAEVAGETLRLIQIGRVEIAAGPVAKGDEDRGGVVLEQSRRHHDAMKALRREPVAVERGSREFGLPNHHLVGQRLLPGGDLLPEPVAGRETPIGRIQASIDADIAEAAELMGLHVLDAEPNAGGPHQFGDFCQRVAPRGLVTDAVIDELDELLGVDHRNTPSGSCST